VLAIRSASGLQAVTAIKVRDGGGTLRTCQFLKVRDATNALRTIWQAMTAALNRSSVDGYGDSTGSITITTQSVTATPSGGTGPFDYAWSSAGGDVPTINSPISPTTTFTFAGIGPGDSKSGSLACTVTDVNGITAATSAVTATATNVNTA
jgi:hypothetical protein